VSKKDVYTRLIFCIIMCIHLSGTLCTKRSGMFPFKVQLFQGCKSETETINTKSVVQHVIRYQVLLEAYYKADTKYRCCCATCLSCHIVDFSTHTSTFCIRYEVLLAAYYKANTKYCCCCTTCLSGHIVDFTTHTSTFCIQYQVLLVAYYKAF
jgi:hypothetical protein